MILAEISYDDTDVGRNRRIDCARDQVGAAEDPEAPGARVRKTRLNAFKKGAVLGMPLSTTAKAYGIV